MDEKLYGLRILFLLELLIPGLDLLSSLRIYNIKRVKKRLITIKETISWIKRKTLLFLYHFCLIKDNISAT